MNGEKETLHKINMYLLNLYSVRDALYLNSKLSIRELDLFRRPQYWRLFRDNNYEFMMSFI